MPKTLDDALAYFLRPDAFPHGEGAGDGDLLSRIIEQRDDVAWDALVRRHGPMVWGVCRRILGHTQDAEDAFQATFVVLVRRATSVRPRSGVANWLYGVARQTAVKARAMAIRRGAREKQLPVLPEVGVIDPPPDDRRLVLDRELSRLPDKYRAPIVMCDLEGWSFKAAAQELGWPEGTLSGRLSRARKMLAERLTRAGVVVSAGPVVAGFGEVASAGGVPDALLKSTLAVGWRAAAEPVSGLTPAVAALTQEVLRAMFIAKLKLVATLPIVVGMLLTGAAIWARHPGDASDDPKKAIAPEPPAKKGNAPDDLPPKTPPGANAKVKELQKERLALLRQIADNVNTAYKGGQVPHTAVLEVQKDVLAAELELCETNKERLAVLEKALEVARGIERSTAQALQSRTATETQLLRAKASRLQAEVEVERAKAVQPK